MYKIFDTDYFDSTLVTQSIIVKFGYKRVVNKLLDLFNSNPNLTKETKDIAIREGKIIVEKLRLEKIERLERLEKERLEKLEKERLEKIEKEREEELEKERLEKIKIETAKKKKKQQKKPIIDFSEDEDLILPWRRTV
jgi:hypothetical protein